MLTAEERVLLHLLAHLRAGERFEVPFELTQAGIALAVGVRRSHVSAVMQGMESRGLVAGRVAHVVGGGRRRRAYVLTPRGAQGAEALRQSVAETVVSVRSGGSERRMRLAEALPLASKRSLVELASSVSDGALDLEAPARAAPTGAARFYGRGPELEAFKEFLRSGSTALAVRGLPGTGKTAFLAKATAGLPGVVVWLKATEWTTPDQVLAAAAARLRESGRPSLAELREARRPVDDQVLCVGGEAADLPILLVLDDIHKAAEPVAGLLRHLVPSLRGTRGKLVAAGRRIPAFFSRREVVLDGLVREIELSGLDARSGQRLLLDRGVPEARAQDLLAVTKGHPLFLELLAATGGEGAGDVRTYLREEVLSRLEPREQELCAALSVHRHPVAPEAVTAEVADASRLESLSDRCLLRLGGGAVEMHDLLREFFLARLTTPQRLRLHAAAAGYYESRPDPSSRIEMLYHLAKAGRHGQAAALLGGLGHGLCVRGFQDDVLRVVGLLEFESLDPVERLPVLLLRGEIQSTRGDWGRAEASFAEAAAVAEDLGDLRGRSRAVLETGVLEYRRGDADAARAHFLRSREILGDADDAILGRILNASGVLEWQAGNLDTAGDLYGQSREAYARAGDAAGVAGAVNNLGILRWQQGDVDGALELYAEALRASEDLGDERTVAILYNNIGEAYRRKGDAANATKFYGRSLALAEKLQFLWQMGEVHRNLGRVLGPKESSTHLRQALEIFERLGARPDTEEVRGLLRAAK